MTQPWSLWLLPDARDNVKYKSIMKNMSLKTGLTSFEPHLTLYGRINVDPEPHLKFFKNMATKQKKIFKSWSIQILMQEGLSMCLETIILIISIEHGR